MSVLKIRNKSGSWTQIPTIKGERGEKGNPFIYSDFTPEQLESLKGNKGDKGDKGDDGDTGESGVYIGTTPPEDEDINVWIKTDENPDSTISDVLINGTSIVSGGVANIPYITSAKNYGLTKLARDASASGLWVDDRDGILYVATASVVNIKAGTNRFAPITPIRSDASTFYGLAKAAGHDEKDSTLPVGTYTEDAIIAIQKMLGVYQAPWELIEDFTLEEDDGFDKSAEPDGTPYNFRSAYVRITVPPNSTSIASGYGRWYFVDENNTILTAESGRYTANTAQMCKTIIIERNANMAMANLNAYTSTGGRAMLGYKNLSGISFNYGNIKHIYTNAQDKEPAGARIEIYTQRA